MTEFEYRDQLRRKIMYGEKVAEEKLLAFPDLYAMAYQFGGIIQKSTPIEDDPEPERPKLRSLAKSLQEPKFVKSARAWSQLRGMAYGVGAEEAYHRHLVAQAQAKGEEVPEEALRDHPDLDPGVRRRHILAKAVGAAGKDAPPVSQAQVDRAIRTLESLAH